MSTDPAQSISFTIELAAESDADRLGQAIAEIARAGLVIGLVGPLGAGKTRLARAIAQSLGVDPTAISSPTFMLIHEYDGRLPIAHFDVYRLTSAAEFEDLGVDDYLSGPGICLVEWADRVAESLPAHRWEIRLEATGPTSRLARLTLPTADRDSLISRLAGVGLAPRPR